MRLEDSFELLLLRLQKLCLNKLMHLLEHHRLVVHLQHSHPQAVRPHVVALVGCHSSAGLPARSSDRSRWMPRRFVMRPRCHPWLASGCQFTSALALCVHICTAFRYSTLARGCWARCFRQPVLGKAATFWFLKKSGRTHLGRERALLCQLVYGLFGAWSKRNVVGVLWSEILRSIC